MKKLFLSILAVAALASCTKSELAYTEQDSEIKLAPVTSMTTKANVVGSIDGTTYPEAEDFRVTAYWTNPSNDEQTNVVYLSNVVFAKKTNSEYWAGKGESYYWPKNGYLNFACYSPASVPGVTHNVLFDTYSVDYTQTNDTRYTVDFMLAEKTAAYTAETAEEDVAVVFEHALSWITIKVKAVNLVAAKAFSIHDIIIEDVKTTGKLAAAMDNGIQYNEWSNQATPLDYIVVDQNKGVKLTTKAAVVEDAERGTVVIPQVPTSLTIKYTQNAINGSAVLEGQTVNIPLAIADTEDANIWEPGKHYTYTIIFSLDEILINPSVTDWEEVEVDKNVEKLY